MLNHFNKMFSEISWVSGLKPKYFCCNRNFPFSTKKQNASVLVHCIKLWEVILCQACLVFITTGSSNHDGMVTYSHNEMNPCSVSIFLNKSWRHWLMLYTTTLIDIKGCVTYVLTGDSCEQWSDDSTYRNRNFFTFILAAKHATSRNFVYTWVLIKRYFTCMKNATLHLKRLLLTVSCEVFTMNFERDTEKISWSSK